MPLIIKVSVSRKLTEDFNSRGWTLDIQSEFDPRTFDDTDALANSTNHLFQLANDLLDQQVQQASAGNRSNGNGNRSSAYNGSNGQNQNGNQNSGGNNRPPNNGTYTRPANGNGKSNGDSNGGANGGSNGRGDRPITSAQINAIDKMAQKFDTNGDAIASEDFNCKLSQLSLRQASQLIDRLKKALEAQGAQAVAR
jgi:hypothetical protein